MTEIISIKDNVLNKESGKLLKAITNSETKLNGVIEIQENQNSGWIYATDEDCNCYLFSDDECKVLEEHYSCPDCGYENFDSSFLDECTEDCCKTYHKERQG